MLVSEYLFFVAELRGLQAKTEKRTWTARWRKPALARSSTGPSTNCPRDIISGSGLAQAILHRPSVLVLDEPTEGLDPNQRLTIRDLIRHLGGDRTVLLSTHVMQEVENTCERVLVISRGKLVANNEVQELLAHAKGLRSVDLEVEGENVESGLAAIDSISSVEPEAPVENRKRYKISMADDGDPRPDIFALAVKRNWVIWELHEVQPRLEDVFHDLTVPAEDTDERVE